MTEDSTADTRKGRATESYERKYRNRSRDGSSRLGNGQFRGRGTNSVSSAGSRPAQSHAHERQAIRHIVRLGSDEVKGAGPAAGQTIRFLSHKSGIQAFARARPTPNYRPTVGPRSQFRGKVKSPPLRVAAIPETPFMLGNSTADESKPDAYVLRLSATARPRGKWRQRQHVPFFTSERKHRHRAIVHMADPCRRFTEFKQAVDIACDLLDDARAQLPPDSKILISCDRGVNRSAAVLTAYLVTRMGKTCQEAIELLQGATSAVDPGWLILSNLGYRRFLELYRATCTQE